MTAELEPARTPTGLWWVLVVDPQDQLWNGEPYESTWGPGPIKWARRMETVVATWGLSDEATVRIKECEPDDVPIHRGGPRP